MPDQTKPPIEYYTVVVQQPEGDEWVTVHTRDIATGRSARDAAAKVLAHDWPTSIYDTGDWEERYNRRRARLAGIAGYRLIVTPASHNRRGPDDKATVTVGELLLDAVAAAVQERRAAKAADIEARKAARRARIIRRASAGQSDALIGKVYGVPAATIRAGRSAWQTPAADTARRRQLHTDTTIRAELVKQVAELAAPYRDLNFAERLHLWRACRDQGMAAGAFSARYKVAHRYVQKLREAADTGHTQAAA